MRSFLAFSSIVGTAVAAGMGGVGEYSDGAKADPVQAMNTPWKGSMAYYNPERPDQKAFDACAQSNKVTALTSKNIMNRSPVFIADVKKNLLGGPTCFKAARAKEGLKCDASFVNAFDCASSIARNLPKKQAESLAVKRFFQKLGGVGGCFYNDQKNDVIFIGTSEKDMEVADAPNSKTGYRRQCPEYEWAPIKAVTAALYNPDVSVVTPVARLFNYVWDVESSQSLDGTTLEKEDLAACKKDGNKDEDCMKEAVTIDESNYFYSAVQYAHNSGADSSWKKSDKEPLLGNWNKMGTAENSALIGGLHNYLGSRFHETNPVAEVDKDCDAEKEKQGQCQTVRHAHPGAWEMYKTQSGEAGIKLTGNNPSKIKGKLFIASKFNTGDLNCRIIPGQNPHKDCEDKLSRNWRCVNPNDNGRGTCREYILNSAIIGGEQNRVNAHQGVVIGGFRNRVYGNMGVVVGGTHNTAGGLKSVALGSNAKALADNSLVMGFKQDVHPLSKLCEKETDRNCFEERFLAPITRVRYYFHEEGHCENQAVLKFEDYYRSTISDAEECETEAEKLDKAQLAKIFDINSKDMSKPVGQRYKPAKDNKYHEVGSGLDDIGYDTPCGGFLCKAERIYFHRLGYAFRPAYDPSHPNNVEACSVYIPEETNRDGRTDVMYQKPGVQLRNAGTSGVSDDKLAKFAGTFSETFEVKSTTDQCFYMKDGKKNAMEKGSCVEGKCCSLTPEKDDETLPGIYLITRTQNGRTRDSDLVNEINQWPEGMELRCRYTGCSSNNRDNSITMCSEHFTITGDLQIGDTKFSEYYKSKKQPEQKQIEELKATIEDQLAKVKNYEKRLRTIQYKINIKKDNLYERLIEQKHEHDTLIKWLKLDMHALGFDPTKVDVQKAVPEYAAMVKALDQLEKAGTRWYATDGHKGEHGGNKLL